MVYANLYAKIFAIIFFFDIIVPSYLQEINPMGKKRKNGEGSWGEVKKNGYTYQYFVKDGKYTYGKTIKEIKVKLAAKKDKEKYSIEEGKQLFGEYISEWLIREKKTKVEPSTYETYEEAINNRIINFTNHYDIANVRMDELDSDMFQDYLDELANHYSKGSINKVWGLIKSCIKQAEIKKHVKTLFLNDMCHVPGEAHVARPKKKIVVPTVEDIETIYQEAIRTFSTGRRVYGRASDVIILIMETGMRIQEVTALTWENVNFDKCEIYINQVTSQYDKKVHIKKRPKTASGNRTIPLSNRALETLEQLYAKRESNFVCVTENKQLYTRRQIERTLERILKRAQCERKNITPHGLRHGFGSILLSEGADIKAVSELLGHADVNLTYNIYIEIFQKDKEKTINILNELRNPKKDNNDTEEESGD